nr:zinc ribbon domain-containing protein [Chloroflexota bacterium]
QEDFVFCPQCGTELLKACPACHRAVRAEWTHCAYCGADLVTE